MGGFARIFLGSVMGWGCFNFRAQGRYSFFLPFFLFGALWLGDCVGYVFGTLKSINRFSATRLFVRLWQSMWLSHLYSAVEIQPFFQFSPWRDPRLRYFASCPFGISRKKHQPFSIAQPFVKDLGVWLCHNVVYLYSILKIQVFLQFFCWWAPCLGSFIQLWLCHREWLMFFL